MGWCNRCAVSYSLGSSGHTLPTAGPASGLPAGEDGALIEARRG